VCLEVGPEKTIPQTGGNCTSLSAALCAGRRITFNVTKVFSFSFDRRHGIHASALAALRVIYVGVQLRNLDLCKAKDVSKSEAIRPDTKAGNPSGLDPSLLKRMLAMAWQYRRGCILPLLLQITSLSLGVLGLGLTGLGLDLIVHAADPSKRLPRFVFGWQAPLAWSPLHQVLTVCIGIISLCILRGCLGISSTIAMSRLIQGRLVVDLRAAVYDKLQRLSFKFYDSHETGSLINRVTGDIQGVSNFINGILLQLIMLVLSLVVYLIYMLRISPRLTLACLASTPILWYASYRFSRIIRPAYRRNREVFDRLILVLVENLNGMHVVKGFNLHQEQKDRFKAKNVEFTQQQRWIFFREAIFGPSISYLTQINLGILLFYGGWMVIDGQLQLGTDLFVCIGLLGSISGQVQGLAGLTNQIQWSLVSAKRVYEVLDTPLGIQSPANAKRLQRSRGRLEFRNVSFEFDPGHPVLRDISFAVEPGQCVGILGPTGAGKTLLLSLIPRFYDPTGGQILIDGVDIREYDLQDLRRATGLVFQESFLFSNTVAANISFGHPDATAAQIEAAAQIAKAHQFITPLPKGYETVLAEGGSNLSGGQKQRLAIARAVILQPSFLLMDDPMAAVDAQTEHEMAEAIESATAGRTTILVANRISTLRRADLILVMQKGRIIQRGSNEQLINAPGYYLETARLQIDEEARKAVSAAGVMA